MTRFHETPVFPRGFSCASRLCGLKKSGKDLSLFVSEVDCAAAGVFTRNQFPGAPVILGREVLKGGVLRAVVVNSKVSNVATGEAGIEHARRMARAAATEVGTDAGKVLVSSTGVIGVPLPIELIERGVVGMAGELEADPMIGAQGIMTTDTVPKAVSAMVGGGTITVVAKGAGMIEPNMATMLVYIFTDAKFAPPVLDRMLRAAVDVSFNMLSVDSDTSTSDTCVVLANGLAGEVPEREFGETLTACCTEMAQKIARDGEGATKLLRVKVRGAQSRESARRIAKSLVNSPLVKTMAYGADPNVGRILMAVGKCFDDPVDVTKTAAWINGASVIVDGQRAGFDDEAVRERLMGDTIDIEVAVGGGAFEATAFGCDLTEGYITENAAYYSS